MSNRNDDLKTSDSAKSGHIFGSVVLTIGLAAGVMLLWPGLSSWWLLVPGIAVSVLTIRRIRMAQTESLTGNLSADTSRHVVKSPLLAAALNLIPLPFAFGYVYLGRWGRFWGAFLLRVFTSFLSLIIVGRAFFDRFFTTDYREYSAWELYGIPSLLLGLIMAFNALDAYRVAQVQTWNKRSVGIWLAIIGGYAFGMSVYFSFR